MAKKKPAPVEIKEDIRVATLDELMGDRFDIYAKDVIQDRAIPDARDGLKPVQRRIIFAMWKTGNTIEKPTKKCAHIVGEVMGKYHPHGDSSIYEALVRMSQYWRVRVPLIDFQGNNGSMDGDGPAAYRYTEARLAAVSKELIRDLEKDTCDMGLTFDDTEFEPTVLPSRFPNMFVNGASGIAVGMATDIPPHNLKEISSAIIHRIQHPSCPIEALMRFVPGPDFPTGGIIYQSQGLQDIYLTGKGRIDVASKVSIEENEDGYQQIIITEIPYGIVKKDLVYAIDKIRHDKTIAGIEEVRDETDKTGLRIAIDIKEGFKPESILAYLYQKTQLKSSYSANMVAIVEGRPQTLNLLSYCDTYIAHQEDVITRRSKFDLAKSKSRLEVVEGLIKASEIIDEIIRVIKASSDKADSKVNLQKEFGFTPDQSEAIVMMPLYKLSHFDVNIVIEEAASLRDTIANLTAVLESKEKLDQIIIDDLRAICKQYGDERRTVIEEEDKSKSVIRKDDLVARETVMVAVSRDGYVKRSSLASWRSSGGLNGAAPGLKAGDTLVYQGQCDSTDYMLMFTTKGQYLYVPVHLLKVNKWLDEGQHVNYAINLDPDEKIVSAYCVRTFRDDLFVTILSRRGMIKRTRLSSFPAQRFNRPIRAMKLLTGDEIVAAVVTSGNDNLMLFSSNGLAVLYNENCVSVTGTSSSGVKAASFKGDECAGLLAFNPGENRKILMITDLAHTRVFSLSNIEQTERLQKATTLFKSFKSEPHHLIYAGKAPEGDSVGYTVTLSDGSYKEIIFPDFYLTPMDKYAKKPEGKLLPKGVSIEFVHAKDGIVIDKDTPSFAPPVVEAEEEEQPENTGEEAPQSVEIIESENDEPAQRFEQISIFGDDDF